MNFRDVTIRVPDQPFLDKSEVAKLARVSQRTIERWVRDGYFPPPLRGGVWSDMQVGIWLQWRVLGPQPQPTSDSTPPVEADEYDESEGGDENALAARRARKPPPVRDTT